MEKTFADFSGGMNALAAVDKLDPRECLLAENVRFDETGNIQSAGAFTHQNTSTYAASTGTRPNAIHSLYWNPSLGVVAGVGQDVFQGGTFNSLSDKLAGSNVALQKMSFSTAQPGRVYFDVGSVGYWSDMNNLLPVDWVPPPAAAAAGGPSVVGAGNNAGSGGAWSNPGNIASTNSLAIAAVSLNWTGTRTSQQLQASMGTNSFAVGATPTGVQIQFTTGGAASGGVIVLVVSLLKGGVAVGTPKTQALPVAGGVLTFGNSSDLWGTTFTTADVNGAAFGFQVQAYMSSNPGFLVAAGVYNGIVTVFAGSSAGMVAGTGTTGTLTGTYNWKVTFVAINGEESDASADTAGIILSGNQGTLTAIPTGDGRTVARNLYRKGGALTSHYLIGTIQDNVSTTYSDNQTDLAALNVGIILAGDIPGDYPNSRLGNTNVRFPAYHYDRVFWAVAGTNKIIWSKPLNGFAYPTVNFFNVGDGKPISRLISIFGELIIVKTDSIWRLTGTDETSFDLTKTPSAVGTDESFTVADLPDKIVFHNRYGFWVFNGYTSVPLTPKLDLWMKQEDRTGKSLFGVNGFHPPEVVSSSVPQSFDACANSEKYYFSYAEAGQTQNNAVLVFDLKHGNITKRPVNALSLAIDPVNGYVYMGDPNGFISLLDDWNGTNGGGSTVNFDYQHGYQDLERGSNKAIWALEFYLNTGGQALTPSVYYDSGLANESLPAITTSVLQRVVRTLESTQSRKSQNFSFRLNGSLSAVNASGTPQVQVVHVKALYDTRVGRARTGQT